MKKLTKLEQELIDVLGILAVEVDEDVSTENRTDAVREALVDAFSLIERVQK